MGERLGRYTVLKHLASGGMADVLLARTDGTGDGIEGFARHVVLKRIRAEHAKDRRFIDMFLDEARLIATLHHQNIVPVHDLGEADGAYFFAMEYLHGEDVRALLGALTKTRAHMPLEHVVGIVSAAAAGLHYAHEKRDIVHRDISPSNILVGYDGSVKVVDFGIAKAAMRDGETRSGVKGKVSYLSPEQCKLGTVDRRSDVYSLGVVLYELATSTRLFKSDSDYLVMDAICTGKVPPPRVRRPDLPPELTAIIMKALATDVANRYQTADELRTALDQFAAAKGLATSASSLAAYLKKLFGEKPEPWLDGPAAPRLPEDATSTTGVGRKRHVHDDRATRPTDLPPSTTSTEMPAVRPPTDPVTRTITDGKGAYAAPVQTAVDPVAERVEPVAPTASPAPSARALTARKVAMIAVPAAVVLGLGIWKLGAGGANERPPAPSAAVAPSTPSPRPQPSHDATVAHGSAGAAVEAGSAAPATPAAVNATRGPAETTTAAKATTTGAKGTTIGAKVDTTKGASPTAAGAKATTTGAATTAAAKAPSATTSAGTGSTATGTTATTIATTNGAKVDPSKGSAATGSGSTVATTGAGSATTITTSAAAPPPPAALPKIAPIVVDNIATHNRKQIAKCEGTEELRGEISVRFEVDAAGRVVKSGVTSTVRNPKVASCLQAAVRTWQFPKTAATGVYTVTYY